MELISWSEKYSVKNSLIDTQHKRLISLINQLHNAMKEGKGKETMQKVLDELVSYTQVHFDTEETMMRNAIYTGFAEHKKEHNKFAKKALSLQESHKNGENLLTTEVMNFLKDWLVKHINGSDKKYIGKIS